MKSLFILTFILSLDTFAEEKKEVKFEEKKAEILKQIDGKIASITEARNCISSAKDVSDLKACREKSKKKLDELRDKRKAKRANK